MTRNRKSGFRKKPKKKLNRYNPNNPVWRAVHLPAYLR